MKKYIFTLITMLLLSSMAYGVASNRVYYHIGIVDQWHESVTSPAITQVDVQNESGTAVAVYTTKFGSTEVGSTGVITSGLADGRTEFWYAGNAIDLTVTDGTRTYEIESYSVRTARFMLPSFLQATASLTLTQTQNLDFDFASWVIDGDTANRLDMIPDNDNVATLAIGDTNYQADVYIYSDSTSDYWLFDEGAGEVYYENLDLQFGDDDILYLGADNDVSITYDETTDNNLEITVASSGMSITTNDFLATLDGVAADQWKVNATGQINGDAINFETTDGGIMLNADGTNYGDIELNSADDMILTCAGDATATVTGTAFIDATADVKLTSSKNAANAVLVTEDGGATGTIKIHADTGTSVTEGASAIQLLSDVGGISLESNANLAKSIWLIEDGSTAATILVESQHGTGASATTETDASIQLYSQSGGIGLYSMLNGADAIRIETNGGASETINVLNVKGTGTSAIDIDSTLGGITIQAHASGKDVDIDATSGSIFLEAEEDSATAISIIADGATASGVWIESETGTSVTEDTCAVEIRATVGGIAIQSDANLDDALVLRVDGGTTSEMTITNDQGNTADSIEIVSAAGGITLDASSGVVFTQGQTKTVVFTCTDVEVDETVPPGTTSIGTSAQADFDVLGFDADGGSTGDDYCFINWIVPAGYKADSADLHVYWTFSTAEDTADEIHIDGTVNATAPGEDIDIAGTAMTGVDSVITDAATEEGSLVKTSLDIEVEDIEVGDLVCIAFFVDESASAMANSSTADVLYFEIVYESTE